MFDRDVGLCDVQGGREELEGRVGMRSVGTTCWQSSYRDFVSIGDEWSPSLRSLLSCTKLDRLEGSRDRLIKGFGGLVVYEVRFRWNLDVGTQITVVCCAQSRSCLSLEQSSS